MKLILPFLTLLIIFGCSNDDNDVIIDPEPINVLTVTNSISLTSTPFSKPREAIVFENNLYAINDANTYKYDFSTNIWELINTNGIGVANYPYFEFNVSFIRNNKWYIINQNALWAFDFLTNNWDNIKQFNNNNLTSPIGVYDNESLYVFSDIFNKIYKYNFESNSLIEHSTFEQRNNYGQLVKSVFKIGDFYYFTKLTSYNKISIYKWVDNFTNFEFLDDYQSEYIAQGSGFVFNDNIIFGLGGESSGDGNGNITSYQLNNEFYYYNTTNMEFKKIENAFYEGRYVSLPIEYNNKFYLLGGQTIINNEIVYKETLDQVDFEFIEN